jgi:hypothetical protein
VIVRPEYDFVRLFGQLALPWEATPDHPIPLSIHPTDKLGPIAPPYRSQCKFWLPQMGRHDIVALAKTNGESGHDCADPEDSIVASN